MLSEVADPTYAPETMMLRESIRRWRLYDQLRTDREAPVRRPQVGTRTLALNHDGADLAAAVQTIFEMGDAEGLQESIATAFPVHGWALIAVRTVCSTSLSNNAACFVR